MLLLSSFVVFQRRTRQAPSVSPTRATCT
jgi:hypothetical protein